MKNRNEKGQFIKGFSHNKGAVRTPEHRLKISQSLKGRKLPLETIEKMRLMARRGGQVATWKGDNAGYTAIHIWLKTNYGKASHCVNAEEHISPYEWALIKGKTYSHNVDNFIQLCRSCHRKYDYGSTAKKEAYGRN